MGDHGRTTPTEAELAEILRVAKSTARSHRVNDYEADEIAQSVAVKLWDKWNDPYVRRARGWSDARWTGYVKRVASNLLLDRIREHQRRLARERRAADPTTTTSIATGQGPPTPCCPCAVDGLLARALIAQEIAALPVQQRIVAARYFLEHMTVAEIAERHGVQHQSIRKHLRAARATLQQRLGEVD